MSTWTNELDVFRDLDRLSGFGHKNVTYPALNAFGRGKLIVKEDENGRRTKIAQFSPPPKIPVAPSCPEVEADCNMQDDTTWERDRELYFQLRQVCGRGYSNELIEEEFRQTEWQSQEQFPDFSCDPIAEDFPTKENNKLIIPDSDHTALELNESASTQLQSLNTELVLPKAKHSRARLFVHPPKLKPSRNALLNSLARRKILQVSEDPKMTGSPVTSHERETGCIAEDFISNEKSSPDAAPSCSATGDKVATPNVDTQKTGVESTDVCEEGQSYGEAQKQCINWSDIRKLKASCYSPVFMRSDGSPVRGVNSPTSLMSRRDSKGNSIAATSILDLPGLSVSANSFHEDTHTSEWKHNDQEKQELGEQHKSKTQRTKSYLRSLPSSPTNSITSDEKLSWYSLRQHNSHPKRFMLSDYIEPASTLVSEPMHNTSEVFCPSLDELSKSELQINSVQDFPPLD